VPIVFGIVGHSSYSPYADLQDPRFFLYFSKALTIQGKRANLLGIFKGSQSLDVNPASAALPPNGRKIRKDFLPCMAAARKFLRISGGHAALPPNQPKEPQFLRLPWLTTMERTAYVGVGPYRGST
jgi:hypothetical protein